MLTSVDDYYVCEQPPVAVFDGNKHVEKHCMYDSLNFPFGKVERIVLLLLLLHPPPRLLEYHMAVPTVAATTTVSVTCGLGAVTDNSRLFLTCKTPATYRHHRQDVHRPGASRITLSSSDCR
ncbi:hypothetical protein CBL_13608 [Carabus blaptoides fortunei]